MNLKHHKTLTLRHWETFPFSRRLLMIANELNRAGHWMTKADYTEARLCYERAIELTCLTLSLPLRKNLRRELVRWKEMLGRLFLLPHPTIIDNQRLQNALLQLDAEAYRLLFRS